MDLFLQQDPLQSLRHLVPVPRLQSKSQVNPAAAAHAAMARLGTVIVPTRASVAPSGDIVGLVQHIVTQSRPLAPYKHQERVGMAV